MTEVRGYRRRAGSAGARNHVFVLPSVVCSALVAREIAEATGAIHVSHQHGCGHIGPDIVQTRRLYVGLAINPNVAHALVVSLGCETVQGNLVAEELNRLGHASQLISIQGSGGNDAARDAGIRAARSLTAQLQDVSRTGVPVDDLVIGVATSRSDARSPELIERAVRAGARVVVAADRSVADDLSRDHRVIDIGDQPASPVSVVRNAGSGAQLLAAMAACRAQVLVDFPALDQPPVGFALAPVLSVATEGGLHDAIADEYDVQAEADAPEIWDRVVAVFSGSLTKAELRGSSSFSIPRLIRTM